MNYLNVLKDVESTAIHAGRDPKSIKIVAVTKNHTLDEVLPAFELGCRDFGENRVQEALPKMEDSPADIRWHFIGTLQKNKVIKVVGEFVLIHSVDTLALAEKISEESVDANITTSILLQVNTSHEASKHGLSPEEWDPLFSALLDLPNLNIEGLMTMAPHTSDEAPIRHTFAALRRFRDHLQHKHSIELPHLSMGMSNDYRIAIEEGATLLRIGHAIFDS